MTLGEQLRAGETVHSAWSAIADPLTVECIAALDFDAVTLDMQHGAHHEDSVVRALPSILQGGKHALVRIPVSRFDMASRALDFGAEAVIAPMINSVRDAELFAASMKYPPVGERSWGPTFAMRRHSKTDPGEWLRRSNSGTLALAMIETRSALDCLDGILAVEGIDGVFVGPSDFSIAWSEGRTIDPALPEMMDTIAGIAERAAKAGKPSGIYVMNTALTGRYHAMGYRLFAHGVESAYMAIGAAAILSKARESIG
jgi:4-hydroxy-2-oxoheptanedioate aldolase